MSVSPTPTIIEEEEEDDADGSDESWFARTSNIQSNRTKMLMETFWDAYNKEISLQHSIKSSSSNPCVANSISIEMNRLRYFITKSYACLHHGILEKKPSESLRIINASQRLIDSKMKHILKRLSLLNEDVAVATTPLPPPPFIMAKKRKIKHVTKENKDDSTTKRRRTRETRPRLIKQNPSLRFYKDEKQIRDCIRRLVTIFYIRDYLQVNCTGITNNPTFENVITYITSNAVLFNDQIEDYGLHYLQSLVKPTQQWRTIPHIVQQFASFCISEIQDIVTYVTYCLRELANSSNQKHSLFITTIPALLRDRIHVRLIKDNVTDGSTNNMEDDDNENSKEADTQYIEVAKKTALSIFGVVEALSSASTTTTTSTSLIDEDAVTLPLS